MSYDLIENWIEIKDKPLSTRNQEYVYIIYNPITKLTKIGITTNVNRRINELENNNGVVLVYVFYILLQEAHDEAAVISESFLHVQFKEKRKLGEGCDLSLRDFVVIRKFIWHIEGLEIYDYFSTPYIANLYKNK